MSHEARRNNDLLRSNHKPLPLLPRSLLFHRSCLLDRPALYSRPSMRTAALDHHLHPPNPTSRLQEQTVLLYLLYHRGWSILEADTALPPCNNPHLRSRCRTIACRDTIVRLPFLLSLNSHISRVRLRASLTLLLLNHRSKDTRYRLSIRLARRPCRCPPPTRIECPACLRKVSNNTLLLHHYSRHGNKGRRRLYLLRHSRSLHHRRI